MDAAIRGFRRMANATILATMQTPAHTIQSVLAHIAATRAPALDRLRHFLAIPSVSAQPAHAQDCRAAAAWVQSELESTGFAARLVETAGHPVVVATHAGPGGDAPHLLYYGHYDVQPAEPLEFWHSPAFHALDS